MKDKERLAHGFKVLRDNLDTVATRADGRFMNPYIRPKDKRVAFTKKQFIEDVLPQIERYENADDVDINIMLNQFSGLAEFVLQCVDDQFQRFRDIYYIMMWEPPKVSKADLEIIKARTQKIREDQREMEWTDRKLVCSRCELPVYIRDINNNYIDLKKKGKREVCQCSGSVKNRSRLKKLREEKRREQEKKKRIPKKDPLRYK